MNISRFHRASSLELGRKGVLSLTGSQIIMIPSKKPWNVVMSWPGPSYPHSRSHFSFLLDLCSIYIDFKTIRAISLASFDTLAIQQMNQHVLKDSHLTKMLRPLPFPSHGADGGGAREGVPTGSKVPIRERFWGRRAVCRGGGTVNEHCPSI